MKSIRKFLLPLLLLCLTASAAPLKSDWKLCRGATLETRDGKQYLRVVIRPEDIKLISPEEGTLSGIVKSTVFMGVHYEMQIEAAGFTFLVHSTSMEDEGAHVGLSFFPDDIHIMRQDKAAE